MILLLLLTALLLQRQRLFHANTSTKEGITRSQRYNKPEASEQKDVHRRKLVLEELSDQITEKK
jgi:hypothetical protein